MDQLNRHESLSAAHRIIGELIAVREHITVTAEGFAVLDFAQGRVATELPTEMARSIVEVLRGEGPHHDVTYLNDLVMLWLENYRRAYSNILMRVFEEGAGPAAM